jgi:hypothetical protein
VRGGVVERLKLGRGVMVVYASWKLWGFWDLKEGCCSVELDGKGLGREEEKVPWWFFVREILFWRRCTHR